MTIDITTVFFRKQGLLLFNVHDIQSICTKDNIIGGFEGGLELQCVTIENRQSPSYVVLNRVTLTGKKLYYISC